MSILESIKEERQLSMNHWRYRLLHWCFNCEAPIIPFHTGLPHYLYSHYCPLFHLTNLIAILSPLILVVKIIFAVIHALLIGLIRGVDAIRKCWPKFAAKEEIIAQQKEYLLSLLKNPGMWCQDFERFWNTFNKKLDRLKKEDVEQSYHHWIAKFNAAQEEAARRRERFRKYLLFWTNFSRVFIKWGLNIFYIGLAAVTLYVFANIAVPIFSFICYLFDLIINSDPVPFLLFALKLIGLFFITALSMVGLLKFKLCQKVLGVAWQGIVLASPPFALVFDMFKALWGWVRGGLDSVCEFISVFYEENCPPIKIVKDE